MSEEISTFYVQSYATNVALLAQQRGSRLEGAVSTGSYKGKAASPVEQIGPTSANKRTTRGETVSWANQNHDRPWVYPVDYDWYDGIDNIDKLRMVVDPQSAYVMNAVNALNRAKDDEIIAAFFADRKTGENGGTTTTALAAQTVAVTVGGTGSGLNVAKLRKAKKILLANELDQDEQLFCAITAEQNDNLLNEIQVTSKEFNGGDAPLVTGDVIQRFLGFNFIHSERTLLNGSSQRRVPAWAKSGMHLGTWEAIKTGIDYRVDLRGKPLQISAQGTFGATRLEEKKVCEIVCAES